jgi:hypothetical protein
MRSQRRGKQTTPVQARANSPLDAKIPLESLAGHLAVLQHSLFEAQRCEDYSDTVTGSLNAVIRFVQAIPEWDSRNLWAPLHNLAVGLDDLKYGTVAPFLRPKKFNNRHPQPLSRKMVGVICVWYSDALMRVGVSEVEACKFVAENLTAQGFRLPGSKVVRAETVANWRGDLPKRKDDLHVVLLHGLRNRPSPFGTVKDVQKWVRDTLPIVCRDLGCAAD